VTGDSPAPGAKTAGPLRDPLLLLGAVAAVATLGVGLRLAGVPLEVVQPLTAALFVVVAGAAVLAAPANGLVLLYLVVPLFNGEDARPYFFLLEVVVVLTVLAGVATRVAARRWLPVPGAAFAVLLVASTVLAIPVDLKAIVLEVSRTPWREIAEEIRRSDVYGPLFYVRTVLNVVSGVALYALAATERWSRETLVRLATATTLMYLAVTALGLWHFWLPVAPGKFMTVAYGWTHLQGGFVGLGFNVTFFGQYALAYFPLAFVVLLEPAPRWAKAAAALAVAVTPYTILSTHQKAAQVVFAVALGLLLLVGIAVTRRAHPHARRLVTAAVIVVVLVAIGLVWLTPVGARVGARVREFAQEGDWYRLSALDAAARMFLDHPVLGVGSGRYAALFPRYDANPFMRFGYLSAHNLYAQLLAEQGLPGLLTFVALLAVVIGSALAARRHAEVGGVPLLVMLASLGAWLVYGLFQYTMLLRGMQAYYWITLGIVASLAAAAGRGSRVRWRWVTAIAVAGVVAAGFRLYGVLATPLPPGQAIGVYAMELDGTRWTRREAWIPTVVEGGSLRLTLFSPFVALVPRPQIVEVWVDTTRIKRVYVPAGKSLVVHRPVHRPRGTPVVLRLRVDYTVAPATLGLGPDPRRLGVQLLQMEWVDP
jgi:O-antigen ligase